MNTDIPTNDVRTTLFTKWQQEHRQLETLTSEIRQWAYDVSQLGIPHFGEASDKLTQLRVRLVEHFGREDEIGKQLLREPESNSIEVQATCRQATQDHSNLMNRLDDLIERLRENEPPFDSWQQAVHEVDLFMDAMEQHEEQENESIMWLLPPDQERAN